MFPFITLICFHLSLCQLFYATLMFMFLIGILFVNSFPALVSFDLSTSRSFLSQSFGRDFNMTLCELECPLRVSNANEHGISAFRVYWGCVLEIFRVPYPIYLIVIPMGGIYMIVGMDWLSGFGAMIDCEG